MIIEKWKNAQTYLVGKLHVTRNMVCQDRTYYLEKNGVKVVALADGAGSKEKSEIGAEIVCEEICNLMSNRFEEFLMKFEYKNSDPTKHNQITLSLSKEIITYLVNSLKKKAIELNIGYEELSSTLLFYAIKGNHYIMGHIGDGVIIGLYDENNTHRARVISDAENGERSNVTFFVPDSNAFEHLRMDGGTVDNLKGVLLTSDGAGTVLFSNNVIDNNVYKLFSNFYGRTTEVYQPVMSDFLSNIISSYSTDDLSLNILMLEDSDTSKIDKDYGDYLLENIVSSRQIVQKSQYCYYIDSSIKANKEFNSIREVKEYLKWR